MAKSKLNIFLEVLREEYEAFTNKTDSSWLPEDVDESLNDYYQAVVASVKSEFELCWSGRAA